MVGLTVSEVSRNRRLEDGLFDQQIPKLGFAAPSLFNMAKAFLNLTDNSLVSQ